MSNPIGPELGRWRSSQPTLRVTTAELKPGHIVIAERRPLRILAIRELRWGQWTRRFMAAWKALGAPGDPEVWPDRPFEFECRWEDLKGDAPAQMTDASANFVWDVLPEHYAVCRLCGELPPCSHVHVWHPEADEGEGGR